MIIGFHIYVNGIDNLNNIMTLVLGNIFLFVGAYILLLYTFELVEESGDGIEW
jgi:hypothetical protein